MTHPTYKIDRIADLFNVPGERRQDCMREILLLLAFTELAGTQDLMAEGLYWTDDGDRSVSINVAPGEPFLKLEVKPA